jgi:anhydro-N-acetylmuramic acid kinase
MKKERYIGIMSGTSMDSIDVVICKIGEKSCELIASHSHPFDPTLKAQILCMIEAGTTLAEVGEIDHRLGLLFAEAVQRVIADFGIDPAKIRAIGSHGQTVWHAPETTLPFSIQLGDPSLIAERTGIRVVADFRRADLAAGGQGAPIAPAFHEFIFENIKAPVAIVNIGGMANITVISETLSGYDTGCGNVLMDGWIARHKAQPYDRDGAWARSGSVDEMLLDTMLSDPYFSRKPPKSTGREHFDMCWLEQMLSRRGSRVCSAVAPQDVQRTLLELTALTVSREVLQSGAKDLFLCGGGVHNGFLVERIDALLPGVTVKSAKDPDWIEAMMLAWLAYKRLHKERVNLRSVTGAAENRILGGIYE